MWAVDGTWERVLTALMGQADADEDLNWAVSVDFTIVRAHQHAALGRHRSAPCPLPPHYEGGPPVVDHVVLAQRRRRGHLRRSTGP
ncbi:hypothetical protein ACGFYT_27745 [Streptomyces sp. NPDC048208]|uniref:hypothetical protein n=1 Tax=unclassified Streptomyces TaxID=2593676 RepID=UPI0037198FAE